MRAGRTVVGDKIIVRQSDEIILVLAAAAFAVGVHRHKSKSLPLLVQEAEIDWRAVVHHIAFGGLELVELRVDVVVNKRT